MATKHLYFGDPGKKLFFRFVVSHRYFRNLKVKTTFFLEIKIVVHFYEIKKLLEVETKANVYLDQTFVRYSFF